MPFNKLYSIDYHKDFDFLGEEYGDLFQNSHATTFQSPLWLHHMYKDLIPELGVDPIIVTVRDMQSDALRLVLPLVRSRYAGLSCIEPADLGICDYNAVVASHELEESFYSDEDLRDEIMKGLKPYHLVFFRKLRGECGVISHVMGRAKVGEMENSSHDVELWAPYEDWKSKTMSTSFRKELRRKRRKLESFGEVTFEILDDEAEIRQAMALMREQRGQRYEDDLFQEDAYFEFYSTIAVKGSQNGTAQMAVLKAGSDIVATEFGLIHDRCYHFILGGLDMHNFAKASPGILVMDYVLEHRVAEGDTRADFTIGDEAYKAKYGATPNQLMHMAKAETMLGSLAHKVYDNGRAIKDVAKKIAAFGK